MSHKNKYNIRNILRSPEYSVRQVRYDKTTQGQGAKGIGFIVFLLILFIASYMFFTNVYFAP